MTDRQHDQLTDKVLDQLAPRVVKQARHEHSRTRNRHERRISERGRFGKEVAA